MKYLNHYKILAALGFCVCCHVLSQNKKTHTNHNTFLKRQKQHCAITLLALFSWPLFVHTVLDENVLKGRLVYAVIILTMVYISFDINNLSIFSGPLEKYNDCNALYDRSLQVTTISVSVATLLLCQKSDDVAQVVSPIVFMVLLFSSSTAIPSMTGRTRRQAGLWSAVQRCSVTYSAGLLCLALAIGLEMTKKTSKELDYEIPKFVVEN